jgi:hypothetical protein
MRYLRVKNWDKLQHPSPKPLPWIKFFTALLAPTKEPCYTDWPDATKALLHHIWLMARVHNNRIPETWLTRERLNLKSRVNLDPLLESGFVWFEDENGLVLDHSHARDARSGVSHLDSLASKTGGVGGFNADLAFESVWSDYPKPIGRGEALKRFRASVKSESDLADIRTALANYLASGEVERGFVQHGKTWFGDWRSWVKPPITGPRPIHVEPSGYAEIDYIRETARTLRTDLRGQWDRSDCTREEASAYVQWLEALPDLTQGAVRLEEWLRQRKTA